MKQCVINTPWNVVYLICRIWSLCQRSHRKDLLLLQGLLDLNYWACLPWHLYLVSPDLAWCTEVYLLLPTQTQWKRQHLILMIISNCPSCPTAGPARCLQIHFFSCQNHPHRVIVAKHESIWSFFINYSIKLNW